MLKVGGLIVHCAYFSTPMAPLIWIHLVFILPHYTDRRYCLIACELFCIHGNSFGN